MEEIAKISIDEFEKQPDGSWISVKNADIGTKSQRIIRICPGMVFRKGFKFCGADIAEALDNISGK